MRVKVNMNSKTVGYLEQTNEGGYTFNYVNGYSGPPLARSFRKLDTFYSRSDGKLFPFFSGLLSEGTQKDLQCRILKIRPDDDFTRLAKTCKHTIGAITIDEIEAL